MQMRRSGPPQRTAAIRIQHRYSVPERVREFVSDLGGKAAVRTLIDMSTGYSFGDPAENFVGYGLRQRSVFPGVDA
jgi:hypothetical protein